MSLNKTCRVLGLSDANKAHNNTYTTINNSNTSNSSNALNQYNTQTPKTNIPYNNELCQAPPWHVGSRSRVAGAGGKNMNKYTNNCARWGPQTLGRRPPQSNSLNTADLGEGEMGSALMGSPQSFLGFSTEGLFGYSR